MADGFVQVAPDSSGKKIDTVELTASGQLVERQRVALGDASLAGNAAQIDEDGALRIAAPTLEESLRPAALDYNDPLGDRSLYDLLDATNPNFVPLGTAPAGIDSPGQRPASGSFPVVLAPEQSIDQTITAVWTPGASTVGANALTQNGAMLNVSAYRSVSFQFVVQTGVTATVQFEVSNDGSNWTPIFFTDSASYYFAVIATKPLTAGTYFFEGALKFVYFRARFTVAVYNGSITAITRLSIAPYSAQVLPIWSPGGAQLQAAVVQIGANNTVTGGVGGLLAVAGNIAAGNTPTGYPLQVAGVDASGKLRVPRVDTSGNLSVTPPDPRVTGVPVNPLLVVQPDQPDGVRELLNLILMELRALNANMQSINTPFMDDANGVAYDPTLFNQ